MKSGQDIILLDESDTDSTTEDSMNEQKFSKARDFVSKIFSGTFDAVKAKHEEFAADAFNELVASQIKEQLQAINKADCLFECLYWSDILQQAQTGKNSTTVSAIYVIIYANCLEELACQRHNITRDKFSEQALTEKTAWLNSKNDDQKFVQNVINKITSEIEDELKKCQLGRLKTLLVAGDIDIQTAEMLLNDPTELVALVDKLNSDDKFDFDFDWVSLQLSIEKFINIVSSHTSDACAQAISDCEQEKEKKFNDDRDEARSYSGQSLQPDPDPSDSKYLVTEGDKETIRKKYPNAQIANSIHSKLNELLTNQVIPCAQEQRFNRACNDLKKHTQSNDENPDSPLKMAGRRVFAHAVGAVTNKSVSLSDLKTLTEFVLGVTAVVNKPDDQLAIKKHEENTQKAIGIKRNWAKLVGGAMLSFLGVALIATSIAVAVATFGVATPLSAMGFALGGSAVTAGITVGAAALAGVGLATTAGIFADRARKGERALLGEAVTNAAENEAKKAPKQSS